MAKAKRAEFNNINLLLVLTYLIRENAIFLHLPNRFCTDSIMLSRIRLVNIGFWSRLNVLLKIKKNVE